MTDEKLAAKEWKKYHKAIKKEKLDEIDDHRHHKNIDYIYDGFFTGFYLARDIFKKEDD